MSDPTQPLDTFRSLFENMLNGVAHVRMIFDEERAVDMTCLMVNHAFVAVTGITKPVVGHKISEVIPSCYQNYSASLAILGSIARGGVPRRGELFLPELNRWFAFVLYSPAWDELVIIAENITERKLAEQALQVSEQRFADIVQVVFGWVWEIDATGHYTYASANVRDILGYEVSEVLGKTPFDFMPPEEARRVQHLFADTVAHQRPFNELKNINVRKDGQLRHLQTNGIPITDEQGNLQGYRGVDIDVSKHKQTEMQRDLFSSALRQTAMPVLLLDKAQRITYLNPAFTQLFGYQLNALQGKSADCLIPATQPEQYEQLLAKVQSQGHWSGKVERFAQDGSLISVMVNLAMIHSEQGECIGFVGSYLDLRPLHEKEQMLRQLSLAVEQSPESIEITDLNANIEYINEAFVRVSGYSKEELLGKNPRMLQSGKTPAHTFVNLWETLGRGDTWQGDFYNRRKNGEEYIEHAIISPIRQASGEITHYIAVKADITAKKRAEAEIHRLAFYDPLTGLPNRTLLLEHIGQALQQRHDSPRMGALLCFNIDRFKTINDAAGQALGDRLLQAVGERLNHQLSKQTLMVARVAGDDFCVLLPNLPLEKHQVTRMVLLVTEQIHDSLEAAFSFGAEHFNLSACLGVALFPDSHNDTPLDILRRANTALHHAKRKGTGQTAFFDDNLDVLAKQRFSVERELHQAILADELRLYLQSQVDANGRVIGAETLVRWQHPVRGLVLPVEFIPIAEESNLIVEISTWVFKAACQLLAHPNLRERDLRIAVNISPRHFHQADFVSQIQQGLRNTGANPAHLTLEITEGMVLENLQDVIAKMRELSALGIHFSMDDFGTGYSSLSYLKRLPINELKIDKSFVQDMTHDPHDAALVEVILSVARHLGLTVVAEGVETEEQAAFLNQRGTVIHQGYLFSKPEPAATWLAKLPPVG